MKNQEHVESQCGTIVDHARTSGGGAGARGTLPRGPGSGSFAQPVPTEIVKPTPAGARARSARELSCFAGGSGIMISGDLSSDAPPGGSGVCPARGSHFHHF